MDSLLAEPKIPQTVLIRPEPRFLRDAMVQLREARGRLTDPTNPHTSRSRDVIAEFILQEVNTIDLRVESSQADHNLRIARLAGRAAAILEQIARERALADAQVTLPPAPATNTSSPLIPAQDWDERSLLVPAEPAPVEPPAPTVETPTGAAVSLDEIAATIRLLGSLRDDGLVTEAEFEAKKAELLARI